MQFFQYEQYILWLGSEWKENSIKFCFKLFEEYGFIIYFFTWSLTCEKPTFSIDCNSETIGSYFDIFGLPVSSVNLGHTIYITMKCASRARTSSPNGCWQSGLPKSHFSLHVSYWNAVRMEVRNQLRVTKKNARVKRMKEDKCMNVHACMYKRELSHFIAK